MLRHGQDWLAAQRIYAILSDDEKGLKFVHGFWEISGETHSSSPALAGAAARPGAAAPTVVHFTNGSDLAVNLQPQGNQVRRVEYEAPGDGKVQMQSTGGGIVRILTAHRIEGDLADGVLSAADALGGWRSGRGARPGGQAHGAPGDRQKGGGDLQAGRPPRHRRPQPTGWVYHDGAGVTATGDHGNLDMDAGKGEFVGEPVVVTSDRGRIEAPRMVYSTDQQIVNARGGVARCCRRWRRRRSLAHRLLTARARCM